jgi:hypothetical protein
MVALDALAQQDLRDRVSGTAQDTVTSMRSRAEQLRTQLSEEDLAARAHELEDTVRERLEDLEPAARQAQVGLWKALRALFAGLAVLPTVLFKVLRAVAGTLDDVAERTDIEERARRAGEMLPYRRRPKVYRRTALLWTAGGFVAGLLGGWLLSRRQSIEVVYDEPQPEFVDPLGEGALRGDTIPRG